MTRLDFYRHQHDLIADAQADHAADQDARRGELAAIDQYLTAFENGTLDPDDLALRQAADHISEVILAGNHNQRKALIEALVAQVKITGPGRIVPVFRIPQPEADTAAEATRTMARTTPATRSPRCCRSATGSSVPSTQIRLNVRHHLPPSPMLE